MNGKKKLHRQCKQHIYTVNCVDFDYHDKAKNGAVLKFMFRVTEPANAAKNPPTQKTVLKNRD